MSKREAVESVRAADWKDVGPLYEKWFEDGPRVVAPDSEPIVVAVTRYGYIYTQAAASFEAAELRARTVLAFGSINPDKWNFLRICYGSEAYEAEGCEAAELEREKEEARWERTRWEGVR